MTRNQDNGGGRRWPATFALAGPHKRAAAAFLIPVLFAISASVPVVAPAHAAVAPGAAALIERHVAWLGGWGAVDGLRDLSLDGKFEVAGLKGTLQVQIRFDGRQRTVYDLKVVSGVEAVDGSDAWERNASGQVEDMGRDKVADTVRGLDRAFGRHLKGIGVEVTALPAEDKDGRTWAVLRFTYPDGDIYDLLLDGVTGESVWTRQVTDGRTQWTKQSDLRLVDGKRVSFRQETLHEQAMQNQTVTWSTAAVNKGLGDELFRRPVAAAATGLFKLPRGATATAWIPMELYMERYIYLQGSVNGVATDILLDSGAGITVIEKSMAEKLGLEATGALPARGVGGTTTAGVIEGVTLQVGELTLGPVLAASLDLSDIEWRLGRAIPVILGKEVFHALAVDIDYPNGRIRFLDPDTFRYQGPGRRLAVLPGDDGHKLLHLAVEGLPEALVSLDTGQGGALTLFRRYAEDNKLLENRRTSSAFGGGVGGTIELTVARLKTVSIAGFELHDVPTTFPRDDVGGAFDTAKLAGNLGTGILNRFRVVFDYAHDCLWLEPGAGFDAPHIWDRTGLTVARDDTVLVVEHVAPGSPAATAGWQAGERVSALDDTLVDGDWWKIWAEWSRAGPGATAKLTMADGTVRTLALADYF